MTAGMTFHDNEATGRKVKRLTEQAEQRPVGLATHRRRLYPGLPDPVFQSRDFIPGCPGGYPN